jgi:hypothetical protein
MEENRKAGGGKDGQREEDEKGEGEKWRRTGKEVYVKMVKEERKEKKRKTRGQKEQYGGEQERSWR